MDVRTIVCNKELSVATHLIFHFKFNKNAIVAGTPGLTTTIAPASSTVVTAAITQALLSQPSSSTQSPAKVCFHLITKPFHAKTALMIFGIVIQNTSTVDQFINSTIK